MKGRAIVAIIRKDIKVVLQNKGLIVPMIISFLIFFIVIPSLSAMIPDIVNGLNPETSDIEKLINMMPPGLQQDLAGLTMSQKATIYLLVYMMAPMFLIIPLMVATTVAADSFAGEKERKTMEALLYTPTTDKELFVAKLLSAWLAAVVSALAGFVLYSITANIASWSHMGFVFFPNIMWLVLIIWVVPAVAGLGLSVMVLASARAQGYQDAYQIGGLVVLPVVGLIFAQISGLMAFSIIVVVFLGLAFWLVDGFLIWFGSRIFRRGRLLNA